jgi:hypothetical protein
MMWRSRRCFLGGAAALVPLPALPSLLRSRRAVAAPAAPVRRLLVWHVPNGFHRRVFHPRGEGTDFTLSPTLAPLEDLRADLLIPRGIANTPAVPVPLGGSHAVGMAALLTCTAPTREPLGVGVSVDQVIANHIGDRTRLPSLQLGIDTVEGSQELSWPILLARHISWATPTRPLPHVVSPDDAFHRMFAGFDPRASRADVERRRALRASVLDAVGSHAASTRANLGADDRQRLDDYLSSVREVEKRVQAFRWTPLPASLARTRLPDETADLPTRVRAFQQLIVLAFKLDVTRVITFSQGNGLTGRALPHLDIGNSHGQTHHSDDPTKVANCKKMDQWNVARFGELLRALKTARDPDGTPLLASSAVLFMSEIGDGNRHDQHDKPMLIAGQLGGAIRTGRVMITGKRLGQEDAYADCSERSRTLATPSPEGCVAAPQLGDLYLALMQAFGVRARTFGATGTRPMELT